jgi:hypothetical protein
MKISTNTIVSVIGVFAGSLLSDVLFGDGIQIEDVHQALFVALIAGFIQQWLALRQR